MSWLIKSGAALWKIFLLLFYKCSFGRHSKRLKYSSSGQTFPSTLEKVHLRPFVFPFWERLMQLGKLQKMWSGHHIKACPGCQCWLGRQAWSKLSGPGNSLKSRFSILDFVSQLGWFFSKAARKIRNGKHGLEASLVNPDQSTWHEGLTIAVHVLISYCLPSVIDYIPIIFFIYACQWHYQ